MKTRGICLSYLGISGGRTGKATILDGPIMHLIVHSPNSSNPKIETMELGAVGDFDFALDEENSGSGKQKLLYLWSDMVLVYHYHRCFES